MAERRGLYWHQHTGPELEALDRENMVVVLPTGSIEWHGPHLPLSNDTMQAEEVAEAAAACCDHVLLLPILPWATSVDTESFTGTLALAPSLFAELVIGILESIWQNGFRKVVIANIHGGNKTTLDFAVRQYHHRARRSTHKDDLFVDIVNCYAAVEELCTSLGVPAGHACGAETAMQLYLAGDEVRDEIIAAKSIWKDAWYIGDMKQGNPTGVEADPAEIERASAEIGRQIFEAMVAHLVATLEDMRGPCPPLA